MSVQVKPLESNDDSDINVRAFVALIIGAVAIGTAPIFMRYAEVTPTSSAFWRLAFSIPLLFVWRYCEIKKDGEKFLEIRNFKSLKPFIIVGFFFATDLTLWHWSVKLTTVANSTLLANMAAVFTAVGGFLFFGERYSKTFISGMFIALLGAMALMGHSIEFSPDNLIGDMLGLTTAIAYAGYMIASASARKSLSTASVMLGTAIFASVFLLPIALYETGDFMPNTLLGWWPLIALAWFTHVVGQGLIIYALAHLPAAFGSVSLLVQPVIAAILAWILFAEALGMYHFIGATLIITGILTCKKGVGR